MTFPSESGPSKYSTTSSDLIDLMNLTDWQRSQLEGMSLAGTECLVRSWNNLSVSPIEDPYCGPSWDGRFCWPATWIGKTIKRLCSELLNANQTRGGHLSRGYAFRTCDENGSWAGNQTNFTQCLEWESFPSQQWPIREIIMYVLFIGSILSLLFLGVAIFIFTYFKSIRCDRITIHIHFMVSLALKSLVLAIISDPYLFGEGFHYRRVEWICKFVMAMNLYTYVSSINWMFVEGHYINAKLTTNVFQQSFHIKPYCCFSWGLPVLIVGIWCSAFEFVHSTEKVFCWKGYSRSPLIWIIVAPVLAALVINVIFLLNIMRVLLTKLQLTSNSTDAEQFRRAAKATLILFPLLGINNLIFFFNPGGSGQAYYMMANAIIQPLQGILVSVLYCFITTDVREAIKREYNRFSSQRGFSTGPNRTQSHRSVLTVSYNNGTGTTSPALTHISIHSDTCSKAE